MPSGIGSALLMANAFRQRGSQDLQRNPQWGIPEGSTVRAFIGGASNHLGFVTGYAGVPKEWSQIGGGVANTINGDFQAIKKWQAARPPTSIPADPMVFPGKMTPISPRAMPTASPRRKLRRPSRRVARRRRHSTTTATTHSPTAPGQIGDGGGFAGLIASLAGIDPQEPTPPVWPPQADRPIRFLDVCNSDPAPLRRGPFRTNQIMTRVQGLRGSNAQATLLTVRVNLIGSELKELAQVSERRRLLNFCRTTTPYVSRLWKCLSQSSHYVPSADEGVADSDFEQVHAANGRERMSSQSEVILSGDSPEISSRAEVAIAIITLASLWVSAFLTHLAWKFSDWSDDVPWSACLSSSRSPSWPCSGGNGKNDPTGEILKPVSRRTQAWQTAMSAFYSDKVLIVPSGARRAYLATFISSRLPLKTRGSDDRRKRICIICVPALTRPERGKPALVVTPGQPFGCRT